MCNRRVAGSDGRSRVGQVERRLVVRVPAGVVWRALTESGELSAWFGGEVQLDPVPGGQLVLSEDGRLRRAVVVDVEPGRRLAFRWLPDHHRVGVLWGEDDVPAGASREGGGAPEACPRGPPRTPL